MFFFFSSRRRHTRCSRDWSSDVCSSDLKIQQDYVDDPNINTVTAGALHGLLESLDPQTSYLTPREYEEYKKKVANPGTGETGMTLSKRFGYIIVLSVLPDSPGVKAGIRSADLLESIGGFTSRDMSVGQAVNLLNGQPGTAIKVAVIRRGKATPDEVDIVRDGLDRQSTRLNSSHGYISY